MNERETSRRTTGNGDSAEEIEIIDVADLLEDPTDADESDLTNSLDDPTEAYSKDSGSDAPMEVDDIFRILEDDDEDDDEEIIDLLDEANGDADEAEGHLHRLDSTADSDSETEETAVKDLEIDTDLEDDFIAAFDLDEILGDAPQAISGVDMPQDPFESTDESDMDFIDALDLDLPEDGHAPPESRQDEVAIVPQQPASPLLATVETGTEAESKPAEALIDVHLTEPQIDAALERVIRSMYAEKIDAILVEAIERTVNGEIDRLKNLLNQGSPDL